MYVHREDALPAPLRDLRDRREVVRSGVVHEDVDRAEGLLRLGYHAAALVDLRDVRGDGCRLASGLADRGDGALERALELVIALAQRAGDADDPRALRSEARGDRFADAAARPGDEGDPSIELAHEPVPPSAAPSPRGCDLVNGTAAPSAPQA